MFKEEEPTKADPELASFIGSNKHFYTEQEVRAYEKQQLFPLGLKIALIIYITLLIFIIWGLFYA